MRQRGQVLITVLFVVVFVIAMSACWRVCVFDNDQSLPVTVTPSAYHCDPDREPCDGGDYGGYHGDQGGGGNGNKGRDGDDQHGDDNCHSFCGNTIIVPTPPGMGGRR